MKILKNIIKENHKFNAISNYIKEHSVSDRIVDVFTDVLKTESTKDYLELDHNKRKVHFNLSISTIERKQLSDMICFLYPNEKIISPMVGSFPLSNESIPKIKDELDEKGYHVFEMPLENELCDEIINGLEKVSFNTKKSTKKISGLSENNIYTIKGNTAWVTNQQEILLIPAVQKIAFDENLLNLVGSFLGSEPILCQTNCWWSICNSTHKSNLSTNAQMYHQDTEYLKFIKVFVYLTDVNEENGPHKYIQGTSNIAQEILGEDYIISSRLEDAVVEKMFGKENVISFTGKKGTIIIEDTFGLHKGTPVVKGARLLLQLEYCNSLYFHAAYSFGEKGLLEQVVSLKQKYPRIFSNFTDEVMKLNEEKFKYFNRRTFKQRIKDKIKNYL